MSVTKNVDLELVRNGKSEEIQIKRNYTSITFYSLVHIFAVYGLYLCFTAAKFQTIFWVYLLYICGTIGSTAGSHRLWSHRSYKARTPLKLLLLLFNALAFQHSAYQWARDHRVHHKYSDTNADPYNINRGFFFAHIGWLFCNKHPDVIKKGRGIDLSDLHADKLVMLQRKYYLQIVLFVCYIIPTVVPIYFWNESLRNAFFLNILRHCWATHVILFINSTGHWNGIRPYNKSIRPVENLAVSIINLGECWHNFHHAFPWDYKAGEFAGYSTNFSATFIELMAKIGWAYDLKFATNDMIKQRIGKTGDGTHLVWHPEDLDKSLTTVVPVLKKWF